MVGNAKAFILGTYHGLPKDNLQSYLDKFCFRFSRRSFGPALGLTSRCAASPRGPSRGLGPRPRIKAHRGHKKAIIAICRMLLTAIWNVLSKDEPYCAERYLSDTPAEQAQVLTTQQSINLLKSRGYIIKDNPLPDST